MTDKKEWDWDIPLLEALRGYGAGDVKELLTTVTVELIAHAADEIERLKREAKIRIDQIEREQEAHLKTMAELNKAADEIERLRLELDMTQATIRVPSQKDDVRTIERLREELVSALDEAARLRKENDGLLSTWAEIKALRDAFCAENERLRLALHDIYEVYAGSEGIPQPVTCPEAYLLSLLQKMVSIAAENKK